MTSENKAPLTLYRGITVTPDEADRVRKNILDCGMSGAEAKQWQFVCQDLRPRLERLFEKEHLSTHDTRPEQNERRNSHHHEVADEFPAVCACGDETGGTYYATIHNRNDRERHSVPLLIEFTADVSDVHVDGRDFLYNPGFQSGKTEGQRHLMSQLFGAAVDRYFAKAMHSDDLHFRLAMCDLAVQDPLVVVSHAANRVLIGGRYNTRFCSAFFVRLPISPDRIISVRQPTLRPPPPQVSVETFLRL